MNKSPELPYYARLFESPELYWSFHKLCSYEAPLRRPFLKILYENADKCKKELDAETLKTSKLSNKIICRPPQSRETIPLSYKNRLFEPFPGQNTMHIPNLYLKNSKVCLSLILLHFLKFNLCKDSFKIYFLAPLMTHGLKMQFEI